MRTRHLVGGALAVGAFMLAPLAHAQPFTQDAVQVTGGVTYGLYMGDDEGDPPNPYGLGLGAAVGYTLGPQIYLGGEFNYFLGGSAEQQGFEYDINIYYFGAVVGYDLDLSPQFVLRPELGIGYGTASASFGDQSESESALIVPVGAAALYSMGSWFLGAEARYAYMSVEFEGSESRNVSGLFLTARAGAAF